MNWKYIVFFIVISVRCDGFPNDIVDIIRNLGTNFGVSLYGCARKELIHVSRRLSLHGYSNRYMVNSSDLAVLSLPLRRHVFVLDLDCETSRDLLNQGNEKKMFRMSYTWIGVYRKKKFETLLRNSLNNLSLLVDSDFLLAEWNEIGGINLQKIYRKHIRNNLELEVLGPWTKRKQQFSTSRKNLGVTMNLLMVLTSNDSLNHLTDRRDKVTDASSKVPYNVISVVASIFNVTLNLSLTDAWGHRVNDTYWCGMIGGLVRMDADIGGSLIYFIKERADAIDFVTSIRASENKFILRQPKLSYVRNVYTLPFDSKVWISVGCLVVLMTMGLYLPTKWESSTSNSCPPYVNDDKIPLETSILDSVFLTMGAICQQGAYVLPNSVSGRIAALILFVSLMFIYVSYSANIVALLQTSSNSIKTIEDLTNSRLTIGVHDLAYHRYFFSVKPDAIKEPAKDAFYKKKISPSGKNINFMDSFDGIRRVKEGLFAFHMDSGVAYKIIGDTFEEDEKCDLQEIDFLQVQDPWVPIQKNSTYKELLKIGFGLVRENGIQKRYIDLIYNKKPICSSKSSPFFSVGIIDCYPAAILLVCGIGASLIVFLMELYIHKFLQANME